MGQCASRMTPNDPHFQTHLATSSIPCLNLSINFFASPTILSAVPLKTGGAIGGFFKFSGAIVDVVNCLVAVHEPIV